MAKQIRIRQEVLNTALAELIGELGTEATPERVLTEPGKSKMMPDVLFTLHGLRAAIECEVGGISGAQAKALVSAKQRVEEGIAAVAVALIYPAELAQQSDVARVKALMKQPTTEFEVSVVTEAEAGPFVKGNFDYVYSVIQDAWRRLLNEDLLSQTVAEIDAAVEAFAEAVDKYPGITAKLAASLGIQGAPDKKSEAADE